MAKAAAIRQQLCDDPDLVMWLCQRLLIFIATVCQVIDNEVLKAFLGSQLPICQCIITVYSPTLELRYKIDIPVFDTRRSFWYIAVMVMIIHQEGDMSH